MTNPRHIHLIGICGTAMASLAGMLQQRGFRVSGSDAAAYPPMSDFLREIGMCPPNSAARSPYFMRCDDFSFSRQISSTSSVLIASRWCSVTLQGRV